MIVFDNDDVCIITSLNSITVVHWFLTFSESHNKLFYMIFKKHGNKIKH